VAQILLIFLRIKLTRVYVQGMAGLVTRKLVVTSY